MRIIYAVVFCLLIVFSCQEEELDVKQQYTKGQVRRLMADSQSKFWVLKFENSADFEECSDGNVYIFSKNSSDTGFVYITEPLVNCDGEANSERDTLEIKRWTLTDSESELFDNTLFILTDAETTTYTVNGLNPIALELENQGENSMQILSFEALDEE